MQYILLYLCVSLTFSKYFPMCHLSGLVRCGYHGPCYPHSKDGHQRREGQRLNVFPLWM